MNHDLAAMLAERACECLVLDSAAHNDRRDWAELAELYTPDARLVRPSGHAVDGRDAIRVNYQQGPADRRTRHVCTNIRVVIDGEHTASATTLVLIFSWTTPGLGEGNELPIVGPPTLGEFVDTFERGEDGWRIAARTARLLAKPGSA